MQWLLLALWSYGIWTGKAKAAAIRLGLLSSMGMQLLLLHLDGLFTWEAVLPLHLCSLFGCLLLFFLHISPPVLVEAVCFLGAPGALLTLFFPAVISCSYPVLMRLAIYQLHVLISLAPLYWYACKKPLPNDPRRTLIWGSGYLMCISWFNRTFGTNYLFLRFAPDDTPLEWLASRGTLFYLCALELLCMLVFSFLKPFYAYLRK